MESVGDIKRCPFVRPSVCLSRASGDSPVRRPCESRRRRAIGRVSYLIYISMRHYVLTTSGDIVVCFYTAVCLNC